MAEIPDPGLAKSGRLKLEWASNHMPLLGRIKERFARERPFAGVKVGISIHLEAKTACLARAFQAGGAEVAVTGSNPLSTQDDVVAALAETGIAVFARHGVPMEEYERHLNLVLDTKPDLIIDDGGDLVRLLHTSRQEQRPLGGCEETTTGVQRLRALEREGRLRFPMFAVNDAEMKRLFDNRYGTGQSVWDGIMRTTNLSIAGKTVVVAGYGWCGKGIALRARGLGANVIVTEVNPIRALEAAMEGFRVVPMREAAKLGEIFITATGCIDVIDKESLELMRDGAILANAGHFDVEISLPALKGLAVARREVRPNVEEFKLTDGRRLYLLAQGRLVNLAAADGHPVEIMDLSFALQALTGEYLLKHRAGLEPRLYPVPEEIDQLVAELALRALGLEIDSLSEAQQRYIAASARTWYITGREPDGGK
ncbi:MAG: adenosylhomocysteinase [Candidatus Acetothermia bacterium]|jgi:adenosylhomocysteinase|nr:adenosylhomocysteinase [Candidatus Acetothermia bacterium]MDH7505441.1 adenosylhomocysteinase [Candidatus Acetothermia bacterium]